MHYLVYQITNLVNGKIYIGAHKTENIDDGYMGSGNLIKRSIKKYGKENFVKTILFEAESKDEMYEMEAELVVLGPQCYNLKKGGEGGFDHLNDGSEKHLERAQRAAILGGVSTRNRVEKGTFISPLLKREDGSSVTSDRYAAGTLVSYFKNPENRLLSQSETVREKRKISIRRYHQERIQRGELHHNCGTFWITDGSKNAKILKDTSIPEGWYKGRTVKPK